MTFDPQQSPSPLDRLRACIVADEGLQHRLLRHLDTDAFAADAARLAADAGIALAASDIAKAVQGDLLDIGRFGTRAMTGASHPGRQWLPVALTQAGDEPAIDWLNTAGVRLDRPFYEDTIRTLRARPLNRLIRPRTPLSALAIAAPRVPDGLIFHMSRCGSTLVAQMLAADPRNIVLSEPGPVDSLVALLLRRSDVDLGHRGGLLRAMIAALGIDRFGDAGHFVVKLDSWHIRALPLFRAAFPGVPWVFLYRQPIDVVMSHIEMRGLQVVPGALDVAYDIADADTLSLDAYMGAALAQICEAAADGHALGETLLVNYRDLPGAVEDAILPHFGIRPSAEARTRMAAAAGRNAKSPTADFVADSENKRQRAMPEHHDIAALIEPAYARLEALRTAVS